jgi:hypothetical protein
VLPEERISLDGIAAESQSGEDRSISEGLQHGRHATHTAARGAHVRTTSGEKVCGGPHALL